MNSHRFLTCFLVIFILWLPWICILYPGVVAPTDTLDQMQQLFGIESTSSHMAGQIRDGFYLNNHHPVIHTLILGAFLYAGQALGSANIGMLLFVLFQILLVTTGLSFVLTVATGKQAPFGRLLLVSFLLGLVPVFPIWCCCVAKDILFAGVFTHLIGLLILKKKIQSGAHECACPERTVKFIFIMIIITSTFSVLLRNSGVYIISIVLVMAFFFDFKSKKFLHMDVALGLVFSLIIIKCVFPALGITPASGSESQAPQFAQVSRIVVDHRNEIDAEGLQVIDENLGLDNIEKNYLPNSIDIVKFNYNQNSTPEQKEQFNKVWLNLTFKFPVSAFKGWMTLWRGYWSPSANVGYVWVHTTSWYDGVAGKYVDESENFSSIGLNIQQGGLSSEARQCIEDFFSKLLNSPLGLLMNMGVYSLALVFVIALILRKKLRYLYLPAAMVLLSLLIYFMAPVDGLYRYVLPCMLLTPTLLVACLDGQ